MRAGAALCAAVAAGVVLAARRGRRYQVPPAVRRAPRPPAEPWAPLTGHAHTSYSGSPTIDGGPAWPAHNGGHQ